MKIKATYKSTSNRRSILVAGVEFVNGHSITVDISETGIAIIKKAAADGWFTIEQEWDKDGNPISKGAVKNEAPAKEAPVEAPAVEEAPVADETPDLSDMTKAELLAYAEENGHEVNSSMTKAEILAVITGA